MASTIIGFSLPLARHLQEPICSILESRFGWILSPFFGFISPGANGFSGIVVHLWESRVALRPMLLYFLTVVPMISYSIYMMRLVGLGTEIAQSMYRTSWMVSAVLLPCFWIYSKSFFK